MVQTPNNEILIYQTLDGKIRIETKLRDETQRFQMEILNSQELSIKEKDNKSYIESLQARCKILKSKENNGNFLAIKKKIETINKVLENKYDFSNIKVD